MNTASIFSFICLPSSLFHNIKIFFPAPIKVKSELSKNLEFPDGKYLYIIMAPSSQTTENQYCFGCYQFHLGILIGCTKSWDLVPLFDNDVTNIAWAMCLHQSFNKYNQMVQAKMVTVIILDGLSESTVSLLNKISDLFVIYFTTSFFGCFALI